MKPFVLPKDPDVVWYWLKETPKDSEKEKEKLLVEVRQGDRLLRRFTNEKKDDGITEKKNDEAKEMKDDEEGDKPLEPKAGLNRVVWDMRLLEPAIATSKETFGDYPPEGPKVIPGTYTVRLVTKAGTREEKALEQSFEVVPDPRVSVPAEDLSAQYDLLTALRADLERAHDVLRKVREILSQAKDLSFRAERLGKPTLKEPAKALGDRLTAIEEKIINPRIEANQDTLNFTPKLDFQISALAALIDSADACPTAASFERRKELVAELDAVVKEFDGVVAVKLAAFNSAVEEAKIPPVAVLPPKKT